VGGGFGLAGKAAAARFDGVGHGHAGRGGCGDGVERVLRGRFAGIVVEGVGHGSEPDLLDLATGESGGEFGQRIDVEFLRLAFALGDVDAPDGSALGSGGQIHGPYVESVDEGIGKSVDVVGGEDEEDAFAVELHILEDGLDHAVGRAAIGRAAGLAAGEEAIGLVDPEDAWGNGLGRGEGTAPVGLGLSDKRAKERAAFDADSGDTEGDAASAGGERFASASLTYGEETARRVEAVFAGFAGEVAPLGDKIGLEQFESADFVEGHLVGDDFEDAVLFDRRCFLAGDDGRRELAGFDDGEGVGVLGLGGDEAHGGIEHGIEGIAFGHRLSGRFAEGGEKALQFVTLRELEFLHDEVLRQFLGQLEEGREDDDGLLCGLGVEAGVLDHAVDDRVRLGQHEMEVAQEEDGFLGEAVDGGENLGGILLAEVRSGANVDASGGARPSMEGVFQLVGHAANHGLGALLLERGQVNAGITGADFMGYGLHWLVSWQFSVGSSQSVRIRRNTRMPRACSPAGCRAAVCGRHRQARGQSISRTPSRC